MSSLAKPVQATSKWSPSLSSYTSTGCFSFTDVRGLNGASESKKFLTSMSKGVVILGARPYSISLR